MTVTPLFSTTASGQRLHEPFLERASGARGGSRPQALGAFLMLRVIDRITTERSTLNTPSLAYQARACADYLDEIQSNDEELTHLREIVRVAQKVVAGRNPRLLWAPMLAFAFWLQQQLRLEEALDVLNTGLPLDPAALDEKIAAHLQRARVLRLAGRFPDASDAYTIAGEMANLREDWRSEMVSRIGRAELLQHTGDLPRAERELREVVLGAQHRGDPFIESRACHGLAVNAHLFKRASEAAALAFRAFELYEEPAQRLRALNDTGVFLKELGHYSAAKDAQLHVLESSPPAEVRFNATIELLEVACAVGDRLSFERWSRELQLHYAQLLPYQQVDYEIAVGNGLVALEQTDVGIGHLERAVELSESYKLGQRVFEAERLLAEARAGRVPSSTPPPVADLQDDHDLRSAIDGVCALRGGSGGLSAARS